MILINTLTELLIMRCKNCGWINEPNATRCIKCNAPLEGSMIDSAPNRDSQEQLKSTIREPNDGFPGNPTPPSPNSQPGQCPRCGYPITPNMNFCPRCQNALKQARPQPHRQGNNVGGTINPWSTPQNEGFCSLRRIPWQTEQATYEPVSYSGDEITLNRANTDSNNNSITSKVQAVITREGDEWYIENRSEMQTTLIRVDRKMRLQDGDVIVLGNRMFEFKKG